MTQCLLSVLFASLSVAAASYRYPTYAEQRKIDESLRRGSRLSPVARDLINEFRNQGGQFAIDPDIQAAYHGRAFRDRSDRPTVALTQAQHDAASARVYGEDGNGDNGADTSLLGYLKSWFGRRGNI